MNEHGDLRQKYTEHMRKGDQTNRPLMGPIMMVDVNGFKLDNDPNGHAAGDTVLATTDGIPGASARKGYTVGRSVGTEFIILYDGMDLEQAQIKAHLMQERVARVNMGVSLSIEIAPMKTGQSLEFNAHQADIAMYAAKGSVINNLNRAIAVKLVTQEARLIA